MKTVRYNLAHNGNYNTATNIETGLVNDTWVVLKIDWQ